jgi:hypothetical protein
MAYRILSRIPPKRRLNDHTNLALQQSLLKIRLDHQKLEATPSNDTQVEPLAHHQRLRE